MASLGVVYGISFVAGSLASMGSAYMASNIYKIEDEEPLILNNEVVDEESKVGGSKQSKAFIERRLANVPAKKEAQRNRGLLPKAPNVPEAPAPVGPVTPLAPVGPVTPVGPEGPVAPITPLAPVPPQEPQNNPRANWRNQADAQAAALAAEAEAQSQADAKALEDVKNMPKPPTDPPYQLLDFPDPPTGPPISAPDPPALPNAEEVEDITTDEYQPPAERPPPDLKLEANKLVEKDSLYLDIKTAVEFVNSVTSKNQKGGAGNIKLLYDIIENGPFGNDNKSLITLNKLNEIKPIIIAFSTNEVGFSDGTEFDSEMIKINKRRAAKILTVTSWLRTVPNKTNITEKDIKEIVPTSLSLKQLIDILSNMIKLDDKKKQNIQINKKTFSKETDVILPVYVLDDTINILTNSLSDKIQIKDLIKYFKSDGTLYTFFKYKNILRLTYDYTLGNIDKIIINLSKVIDWLETTSVNKITNANIEGFDDKSILVETLFFLINERVQVKSKIIRVTDFNAIETLDLTNVDNNTKIISWLIDPSRATLPKPTKEQYLVILKELGLSKIDKNMMKVPTLFVGPIVLPDIDPKTEGTNQNVPDEYTQAIPLLEKIEGVIEKRGESIKEFSKKSKEYDKTIREKESKEFMKRTETEKFKKLIDTVTEKDKKIKELEIVEKRLKEDAVLKEAAKKVFNERLKKAVEKQNLKDLENLLKERDVELSKEYETVKKESENRNKGLVKPPNLDQKIWDKILNEVKAITDPLKLPEYITNFETTNPAVNISPFTDVGKMINAIYSSKQSKGNAPSDTKSCSDTTLKKGDPCVSKKGNLVTKTGGGRTLHNRLRNSRYFTRRNI